MKIFRYFLILILFLAVVVACDKKEQTTRQEKIFRLVDTEESGLTFRNNLKETVDWNIFSYLYFYNGGGVAVGDVNGDGLSDIYFTANQDSNRLFINRGNLKFEDVTAKSGVEGINAWATGATIVDVNADGRMDIYVNYVTEYAHFKGHNQLFVNEGNDDSGIPRFIERAEEFGLAVTGFCTQGAFFDYDLDGDLDLYQLKHSVHQNGTFAKSEKRYESHPTAGDKLLRNDDGKFVDVTANSGIYSSVLGYGLGVVVSDVNVDGYPDIYIGNDFHENDYLYINEGNGTFKESLEQQMMHTSRFSMGVDAADINNDLFPDVMSLDMLPADPKILKASAVEDPFDVYQFKLGFGYNYQYSRNMLQLNLRNGHFSEIGLYAGVAASDWSWGVLAADYNLDGAKDIFISNGIVRRSNDLDYINFASQDSIQMRLNSELTDKELAIIQRMPEIKLPNHLYLNNNDSTFKNVAIDGGMEQPSYSNGSAYADFDNDGDLDLVVNNINDPAFLYENLTVTKDSRRNNSITLRLEGSKQNIQGIGAKILAFSTNNGKQFYEAFPTRGFQSSVTADVILGAGKAEKFDSLVIIWPDRRYEILRDVKTNQVVKVNINAAKGRYDFSGYHPDDALVSRVNPPGIQFKHSENFFVEFNREPLLVNMMSTDGPAVAVADVNGDKLEDIYFGGGKWQTSQLYTQNKDHSFTLGNHSTFFPDSVMEDIEAEFFDADGDGDKDLFVLSGGNEFYGNSAQMLPRLYVNDGQGNFQRIKDALPSLFVTGSALSVSDIDKDGDTDVFIGVRAVPWSYGEIPACVILRNDGKGKFSEVTPEVAPELKEGGFVRDAAFADVDNNGYEDLIIAGEWMPITIYLNEHGNFKKLQTANTAFENTEGWWSSIECADVDQDGDLDLLAGNYGMNSKLKPTVEEPVTMYFNDFDDNGKKEQIFTYFVGGREVIIHTKDELTKQMPSLKKKFISYQKFSEASLTEIVAAKKLKESKVFVARNFESCLFLNDGNMKFRRQVLPKALQFFPVMDFHVDDINGDTQPDVLAAGNFYEVNIQMGRIDASYGALLVGNKNGSFSPVPNAEAGLSVEGQTRRIRTISIGEERHFVFARNNDTPVFVTRSRKMVLTKK
jgi:enediyne biosynthesis protein E4